MARNPRLQVEGGFYHVTPGQRRREDIFSQRRPSPPVLLDSRRDRAILNTGCMPIVLCPTISKQLIYISEEISAKAMFYVEQHFLSHSMQLADACVFQ
jgi:hypothetical protein